MIAFALDMDGTVYKGEKMIPGAAGFVSFLKERGIPFVFLTNNSSHGRGFYLQRLKRMGFDVSLENILTSTTATAGYLRSVHPGRSVYPVGVVDLVNEISEAGIEIDEEDPDIVLLAFDTSITYEKINKAYRFLKNGSLFVATHPDDLCPTEDGYDIDIGPFIRMFESMTGAVAEIVGKPDRRMLEMAAEKMGVKTREVVMVGDRIYTDMRMAENAGTRSVLVLSGEATREDLKESGLSPTAVVGSVAEIPALIEKSAL
ncbi:MAG: HAD-IIA family hydrolase [Candidatus Methanomethylophilaceae archaeon]|nr:HAD-IIA family hydrolase [Candidatus Methanomethylophilaceae archaeon]